MTLKDYKEAIRSKPKLSIIVTCKDPSDEKYKDFIDSVKQQTFQDYEIITVTEGDSESAKAIGLRRAKGEIVGIFASDNFLDDPSFLARMMSPFQYDNMIASSPLKYSYMNRDNILNRYFALLGVNDVIPYYLDKHDRQPQYRNMFSEAYFANIKKVRTYGDNGFFVRKNILLQADLKHYYHIDVCQDLFDKGHRNYAIVNTSLWHRTGGNIFKFFWRRFKYADKFITPHRRWHMVTRKDLPKLIGFILGTLLIIPRLSESIYWYIKLRDVAWFMHWPVCILTVITYGTLWTKRSIMKLLSGMRNCLKKQGCSSTSSAA